MRYRSRLDQVLSVLLLVGVLSVSAGVNSLRCEHLTDPLGIDRVAPRLSWQISTETRGARQSAYRILVASSPEVLAEDRGDIWDSGKVESDLSHLVPYAGRALVSHQSCFWKVRVWDEGGKPLPWSAPGSWTVGILDSDGWQQAQWIAATRAPVDIALHGEPMGYHAHGAAAPNAEKWVQVDLGERHAIDRIEIRPSNHIAITGFGFPHRYRVEVSNDADFADPIMIADHTGADVPNTGGNAQIFEVPDGVDARYVRMTTTKLWKFGDGPAPFLFALDKIVVMSDGCNVASGTAVQALDSIESHGWGKRALTALPENLGTFSSESEMRRLKRLPIFRREFSIARPLRRAVVSVCGLGQYELYLNGEKVGDRLLDPAWTDYQDTCLYSTYDVTEALAKGTHAFGVMLGNGMYHASGERYTKFIGSYGQLKLILNLRLEYADGSIEHVVSDKSWRTTEGPVTFSSPYGGEDWDARLEPKGWLEPEFDDSQWWEALEVDGPDGRLRSTIQQPVKATQVFNPVAMLQTTEGVAVDFGQNSAAIPVIRLKGSAGATVRIRTGEGPAAGGWDRTWFDYTLRGEGVEEFRPRFTSWGHRSILVEGAVLEGDQASGKPVVLDAEALSVRCSAPLAGSFETNDELINKIYHIVLWSIHSNFQSVLTDCPHREKLGWLEVTHLMGPSIMYIYDAAGFYTKILKDCAEAQTDAGMIPDIAPEYIEFGGGFRDSPEWGSAFIIDPSLLYTWTGDDAPIAEHYEAMKRYIKYLRGMSADGILSHGLGDWMPMEPTPVPLVATSIFYHDLDLMGQYAGRLGKPDEADAFRAEAEFVKAAFNARFLDETTGQYANGTQTAQGMPAALGLVPDEYRQKVLDLLVANGEAKKMLTGGDVGNCYAIQSFADAGAHELLYKISSEMYGFQACQPDRTTLAEAWRGGESQNHCMLGHILNWYHGWLAGIRPDPSGPGFKKFIIDPNPVGDLKWVKALHDSPYGRIAVQWRREESGFHLEVTIPPNSTATVHVPAKALSKVSEGGQTIGQSEGVEFVCMKNGKAVLSVDSGQYKFLSK